MYARARISSEFRNETRTEKRERETVSNVIHMRTPQLVRIQKYILSHTHSIPPFKKTNQPTNSMLRLTLTRARVSSTTYTHALLYVPSPHIRSSISLTLFLSLNTHAHTHAHIVQFQTAHTTPPTEHLTHTHTHTHTPKQNSIHRTVISRFALIIRILPSLLSLSLA